MRVCVCVYVVCACACVHTVGTEIMLPCEEYSSGTSFEVRLNCERSSFEVRAKFARS